MVNMVQQVEMSHSEKVEMYRMIDKERLIEMLISANNAISEFQKENCRTYIPSYLGSLTTSASPSCAKCGKPQSHHYFN